MPKQRIHTEYFRIVSLGGRKSCPNCLTKVKAEKSLWSWGEYQYGKWHTVKHFCSACFQSEIQPALIQHADPCGCMFELRVKSQSVPTWLTVPGMNTVRW